MKTYMVPLTFLGGAFGWPTVKAVLLPIVMWSGTAAGGAAYVHWVIKSHNANVVRLSVGGDGTPSSGDDLQVDTLIEHLTVVVASRDSFVDAYRADSPNRFYVSTKIDTMRTEDAKIFAEADQIRAASPSAITTDMMSKIEKLRTLDGQLETLNEQLLARSPS